jgi:hypothetical protein
MCHRYFTAAAIENAKDNIWDTKHKEVIRPGDLTIPTEAIAADILRLGLKDAETHPDDTSYTDTHALNVFLGNEESSVATFTSGKLQKTKLTSKFADNTSNSSSSSVNTSSSVQLGPYDIQNILKSIASLSKTVTLLDANVKSNRLDSEEIIGKIITLEKQLVPSTKSPSNPETSTVASPGGSS